jgi:hypothetical protein
VTSRPKTNSGPEDATVNDAKEGTVPGTIDLGGVPEQAVGDGKGMLYVVMQDSATAVYAIGIGNWKIHRGFVDIIDLPPVVLHQ